MLLAPRLSFRSFLAVLVAGLSGTSPAAAFHHPHDVVSAFAISPGQGEDISVFVASPGSLNLFLYSDNLGKTFRHARSGMGGSHIEDIEIASDWTTSGRAFVTLPSFGLYATEDRGKSWSCLLPLSRSNAIAKIALPPRSSNGEQPLFFTDGKQVHYSSDAGKTFESRWKTRAAIKALGVSPGFEKDRTVAIGTDLQEVALSRDGGETWTTTKVSADVRRIAISPNFQEDGTLWVATHGAAVLRSTDGGKSFSPSSSGITDVDVNDVVVPKQYADANHVFAATRNEGVMVSRDGGDTWTNYGLRIQKTFQTDNHFRRVHVSDSYPEDPTVVCGTYEGLYFTTNGGDAWREAIIDPTRVGRRIGISPNFAEDKTLFVAGYGQQVLISEDAGDSWQRRQTGFDGAGAYSIAVSPDFKNDNMLICGVGDGVRRSVERGKNWTRMGFDHHVPREIQKRPGATFAIKYSPNYLEDRTVYATCGAGELFRSQDAGASWDNLGLVTEFVRSIGFSPDFKNDSTMFVSGRGLFRSEDGGKTFHEVLGKGGYKLGLYIPKNFPETGELFLKGHTEATFMRSSDRGETWEPRIEGLEGHYPTSVAMSPDYVNDHTIYMATLGGGLFRTQNSGESWERIIPLGTPFDSIFVMALSPEFKKDKTMFVGTYEGFWRSRDGGKSFEHLTSSEYYDDTRDPWVREGVWRKKMRKDCLNNGIHLSKTKGDVMRLSFMGHGYQIFGMRGPDYGIAEISLDGEIVDTVDCYAENEEPQVILTKKTGLTPGYHVLEVKVLGEQNEKATAFQIGIDSAEIFLSIEE